MRLLLNNKELLSKRWKTSDEVLKYVEEELGIEILPLRRDVGYIYSRLILNEAQDHRDPSDSALAARLFLLFPFFLRDPKKTSMKEAGRKKSRLRLEDSKLFRTFAA